MLRNLLRLLTATFLIALALPVSGQEAKEWPKFEGIWDTERGQAALWQAEDAIWGVYGSQGELGGHVSDDGTYYFTWDEKANGRGSGWLKLAADGKSFDGQWIKDLDIGTQGTWHGELMGPNTFKVGDRDALKWKPGQSEEPAPPETPPSQPPAAPPATPPAGTPPAEPPAGPETAPGYTGNVSGAWTGTWDTSRGSLIMTVDNITVNGTFDGDGVLQGTIDGSTMNGKWSVTGSDGAQLNGQAIFWLGDDGKTFRGTYDQDPSVDLWLVWSGKKVSDSTTPESATSAGETEPATSTGSPEGAVSGQ